MATNAEPRVEVIEGQRTLVVERRPPLQQKLDGLLAAMPAPTYRDDIRPGGMSVNCQLRNHRFRRFREGKHVGLDGVVRDLRLEMCLDCGGVCVRDISFDVLEVAVKDARGRVIGVERVRVGGRGPNRKDDVLGWYSGARRNGREYR